MSRFNSSLGHRVGHQEEVELAVNYLLLLHEALVDVGSLRRIDDASLGASLEEPLPDSLVDDDERVVGQLKLLLGVLLVFFSDDLVELFQLVVNHLGPHGVSDTISVDEDMVWQFSVVVFFESLEGALEVELEDAGADDLLPLLPLR